MTKELKIMGGIVVLVIAGAVLLFFKGNAPQTTTVADPGKLVRDASNMTGVITAKVTLVEFGDYQCPFCGSINPALEKIIDNYKGNKDFNFVYRNFPLPQHQWAKLTAEAAEAAGAQGKYWEMHNLIFDNQSQWTGAAQPMDILTGYAQSLELDVNAFTAAVQKNQYDNKITGEDLADGNALGVNSTPTLFLNGKKTSASTYDDLKKAIDDALKQ
ncbi:MAG: thioredoxin domain-containing protein [Candidatus Doudnabacteria bacterium]